jgi:hypothetical protein
MARSTANLPWRRRIETGIAIAAPVLDVLLAVGDRVSRVIGGSEEGDHVPARVQRSGEYAARGLRPRESRTERPRESRTERP